MRRRVRSIRFGLARTSLGLARTRHRSQTLVEYGLIAACVAFAGLVGLSALSSTQRAYFTGLPLDPPVPSVPGAILHNTVVDTPSCTTPVALYEIMTCDPPTVRDMYVDNQGGTKDRKPPLGTITVHWDNHPNEDFWCALVPTSNSTSSVDPTCLTAGKLTWKPTDPSLTALPHQISFWYGYGEGQVPGYPLLPDPGSNHVASKSDGFSVTFLRPVHFNGVPQCGSADNQVEVGEPIVCTVKLYDTTAGTPAPNVDVTWTTVPDSANGTGTPLLSCVTGGNPANYGTMLWDNPPSVPSCAPGGTLTCTTDATGTCSVIFRRIRISAPATSVLTGGYQDLQVSYFSGVITLQSGTAAWQGSGPGGHAIRINAPSSPQVPHDTVTWMTCTPAAGPQPSGTTISPPITISFLYNARASFTRTSDLSIQGPAGMAFVSCTATVIDTNPGLALDCSKSPPGCVAPTTNLPTNPDADDAHSPVGTVQWSLLDGGIGTITPNLGTCVLSRLDLLPPQPPNQTPYASTCVASLTLKGSSNSEFDNLVARLVPPALSPPTHVDSGSSFTTHVSFSP